MAGDAVASGHDMSARPKEWFGSEQIAMLLYPGFTALDLVGPQYCFASLMGATVHLVAADTQPVMSDTKLAISPTTTFAACPRDLDVLFIPGGSTGTLAAMRATAVMDFVADRGSRAAYVSSVCTGSLILGQAALLKGYSATSHWAARDLLPLYGATPVDKRYVIDRNRITGAGVTAGIDLGLAFAEMRRGRDYAEAVQLLAEYDPQPPFMAGTPEKAGPKTTVMMQEMFTDFRAEVRELALKRG
jgi:putative intracellular protease/amidase